LKAPVFAWAIASITSVTPTSGSSSQAADAVIRFNVTAHGGDVYVRNFSGTNASSGIVTVALAGDATSTVTVLGYTTNATSGTSAWKVGLGDTKYFEVTTRVANLAEFTSTYGAGAQLNNVYWATTDSAIDGDYSNQTWGLDDIKTGAVALNPRL